MKRRVIKCENDEQMQHAPRSPAWHCCGVFCHSAAGYKTTDLLTYLLQCISAVVCRHKQLKGLGHRLVNHFKQQFEQKNRNKKRRKEKRNSTKKELREDGKVIRYCVRLTDSEQSIL